MPGSGDEAEGGEEEEEEAGEEEGVSSVESAHGGTESWRRKGTVLRGSRAEDLWRSGLHFMLCWLGLTSSVFFVGVLFAYTKIIRT